MGDSVLGEIRGEISSEDWEKALNRFEIVIASGTVAMQIKATIKVSHLSKIAPGFILVRAVPILINLLDAKPSNNSLQEAAADCLKRVACRDNGALAVEIGKSGVVQSILRLLLLPQFSNRVKYALIKCLWCLVNFCNVNRVMVARNGGLKIVINMLDSWMEDDGRLYLLEILSALALLREVRKFLIGFGGLRFLVEAARFGSLISKERACQAIGLLGVTRRVRFMLVELGVIPVLVELFREGDGRTKIVAGNSLGVISAHVDFIRPLAQAGVIPLYAELLQGPDPVGREIAEDVFCLLAVAEGNAVAIAEHLVRILREGDDEAKIAAADVFWDLAGYKHSNSVVRNSGAIPILVMLLRNGSSEIKEKVSGAVSQLSYDEANRLALIDAGAVPILIELLGDESEELRDNVSEALINFSEDPSRRNIISEAVDVPSFQNMRNRLTQIRASNELLDRSLRRMSIEHLTRDPDLL